MNLDDDLTLKKFLSRADDLEPGLMIKVYFTPDTYWFYIRFSDVLPLFLPDKALPLGTCTADNVGYMIEAYIAKSLLKILKSA